ncbi:MAG: toll/interleukin-1 receptor domain-containing protein [Anaerolineae bacterium]|nr:toll/interleukin-1 receptor domain-containing protein [Anaerolineae bacterium]
MTGVFLSYSRKDRNFVCRLAADLELLVGDVWIDIEDIPGGQNWSDVIQRGLDDCEAMVLVISPDSMKSHNVQAEWQYLLDQGKPLIPVRYRPAQVHFQIHRLQYIDFYQREYDMALKQLMLALRWSGVQFQANIPLDPYVTLPAHQPPLPVRRRRKRRPVRWIAAAVGVVMVLVFLLILALTHTASGSNDAQASGTLAAHNQGVGQTLVGAAVEQPVALAVATPTALPAGAGPNAKSAVEPTVGSIVIPPVNPNEAELLLVYNAYLPTFDLINVSGEDLDVLSLSFAGTQYVAASAWLQSPEWNGAALRAENCMGFWGYGVSEPRRPNACQKRQVWWASDWVTFWTGETFDVRYDGRYVTTCVVEIGRCWVDLY